jgi:hypothetical protein
MEPLAANAETGVLWVHKKSGNWIIKSVTGSAEKHRKPDHPLKIVLPVWSASEANFITSFIMTLQLEVRDGIAGWYEMTLKTTPKKANTYAG